MRKTGRTTRMLEEAKRLAESGRAVYVIAANDSHARQLERQAGNEYLRLGVKFESPASVGNFDWKELRLLGAHSNCVVLVDHHAIESHFARMLEMLHRFDLAGEG